MTVALQLSKTMALLQLRKKLCASKWKLSARLRSRPRSRNKRSRGRKPSRKLAGKRRRRLNEESRKRRDSVSLRKRPSGSVKRKKRCRGCAPCKNSSNAWRSRSATSN